jgi:hypothetical protein
MIKKLISLALIFSIIFWNFLWFQKAFASEYVQWEEDLTWCKEQKFLITAYYSPLPGQRFYMRWDYTADIRLNWNWTNWADWTEVYMWLLAWPKWYNFWTKIVLPWLWIWTIHDRWWAILAKSDYHRIDIWMWKWEHWLARALNWGIQFVDWKVCDRSPELDNLSFLWVSPKLPAHVEKRLIERTENLKNWWTYTFRWSWVWWKTITIWWNWTSKKYVAPKKEIFEFVKIPQDVWFWDEWQDVLRLQIVLKNIWFYRENPNWIYDNATMEAVFNFQRENWVVEDLNTLWAWHFWKNTRKALEEYLKNMSQETKKSVWSNQSEIIIWEVNELKVIESKAETITNIADFKPISKEDIFSFWQDMSVKQIQQLLKEWKKVQEFNNTEKELSWWDIS